MMLNKICETFLDSITRPSTVKTLPHILVNGLRTNSSETRHQMSSVSATSCMRLWRNRIAIVCNCTVTLTLSLQSHAQTKLIKFLTQWAPSPTWISNLNKLFEDLLEYTFKFLYFKDLICKRLDKHQNNKRRLPNLDYLANLRGDKISMPRLPSYAGLSQKPTTRKTLPERISVISLGPRARWGYSTQAHVLHEYFVFLVSSSRFTYLQPIRTFL